VGLVGAVAVASRRSGNASLYSHSELIMSRAETLNADFRTVAHKVSCLLYSIN
jgi:hypothetical protein